MLFVAIADAYRTTLAEIFSLAYIMIAVLKNSTEDTKEATSVSMITVYRYVPD